ncbi:class I fructose-bisphosphate aldolase family protein [Candidatus Sumerlaeota bacterium]|nr:2-amino-3,7-dideoxy-D-threo-hept-6-ulosonate synthase [Candidatus Sumerlaeales bacterium]NLD61015.1 class I fructose-bisphosphate aldolase family protein [Candidatus Sumerlaeota bacterium]
MNIGKAIRMERLINRQDGRTIIVPLDHGVSVGPIDGLVDIRQTVSKIAEGGADAVLMHKGLVGCGHRSSGRDLGLILHLSASTSLSPFPNAKALVATVEDALRLGADAVSVHINIGDETEHDMLVDFGYVSSVAREWGVPLLAMVYGRGPNIKNEYDPTLVAHCARVGMELGADVVKVGWTGSVETFSKVVAGSCIPVVIAGGPKLDTTKAFLTMTRDSIRAGASGLSVGRNIFQNPDPQKLLTALRGLVHENWSLEQALDATGENA